ncbi:fimbrial protein [Citrobacter youngae]|uniref:Fimbrial protein n=1 Tax=Citrobacter youngae ATCC 29220 TaxID=500640 RepID=D4BJZ1_9ENTR|nr:fimbrial protein [Citrobacter youngae]EFE06006.1 fimbrial protein [Citrobacter youngae ATCC 29220]
MKKIIQLGILAAAITASCATNAADSKGVAVEFSGILANSSCNVSVNGGQTIDMGTVSTAGLKIGDETEAVPFTVDISGCPSSISTASLDFEGTSFTGDNTLFALTSTVGDQLHQIGMKINAVGYGSGVSLTPNVGSGPETLTDGAVSIPLSASLKLKSSTVDEGKFAVSTSLHVIYD